MGTFKMQCYILVVAFHFFSLFTELKDLLGSDLNCIADDLCYNP